VNFATGANHVNLPQVSDNLCANCHLPQGEVEFDASIKGAHIDPVFSSQLPGTTFKIEKVENNAAGQKPRVTFSVTDKSGKVIDATKMASLSLVIAGPTTDYASYRSETATSATPSGNSFVYNFTGAIDAAAKGTYAIGIQGYNNIKINPGTTREMTARDAGMNQVTYFSVDNSPVVPRRRVVALENCNSCHGNIALHGGSRRNTEFCVMCHNPNTTDAARRTAQTLPAQSVHFKTMIHKIHTGEENTTDFTVFGFGGTGINFNEVRFPGDRRDCAKCHVNNSYQIPLPDGVLPSQSPRDWIKPTMEPIQAACLACHTTKSAAAHASLNTSPSLGEACDVCHGPSAEFNINKMHAR
jgi:OmcA/MtrC family decaheme c-type cytochrome